MLGSYSGHGAFFGKKESEQKCNETMSDLYGIYNF